MPTQSGSIDLSAVKSAYDENKEQIEQTQYYFWYDTDGAHVTVVPQEDFLQNPTGPNVLIDGSGMNIRDGSTVIASFDGQNIELGKNALDAYIKMCDNNCIITSIQLEEAGVITDKSSWILGALGLDSVSNLLIGPYHTIAAGSDKIAPPSETFFGWWYVHNSSVPAPWRFIVNSAAGINFNMLYPDGESKIRINNSTPILRQTFNVPYSVPANGAATIATGITPPSGYSALGYSGYNLGNDNVIPVAMSMANVRLKNVSGSAQSGTMALYYEFTHISMM